MKKPFKKKYMILAVLVFMLAAAIYVNWQFTGNSPTEKADKSKTDTNLGDAEYVAAQNVEVSGESEYFKNARNDRQKARDDEIEQLEEIKKSVKSSDEDISAAVNKQIDITTRMETEANIESLVKAKGFNDCIAVISDDSINIVVSSKSLENSEILQIQDVVLSQKQFELDNIKIINVE